MEGLCVDEIYIRYSNDAVLKLERSVKPKIILSNLIQLNKFIINHGDIFLIEKPVEVSIFHTDEKDVRKFDTRLTGVLHRLYFSEDYKHIDDVKKLIHIFSDCSLSIHKLHTNDEDDRRVSVLFGSSIEDIHSRYNYHELTKCSTD